MIFRLLTFLALLPYISAVNAYANDSIARVRTGGVTLMKNDNIRMAQEELEISTNKIRVYYRFINESNQDIKATVAFPMPTFQWTAGESPNQAPLKSFTLWVNNRLVPTQRHRIALIEGRDVTENLRKIGLSEAQIFETFGDCRVVEGETNIKCGLTKSQSDEIAKLNVHNNSVAPWEVSETAYWEQVFTAGKEIEVVHEYSPFVGMIYTQFHKSKAGLDSNVPVAVMDENEAAACLDEGTRKAVKKHIKAYIEKGAEVIIVNLHDVEYILGTARNWKGPIKNFKLIIRKESPDQLVSLCFPGKPRKTSPTTLEFSQSNFVPQDKLIVYFYTVVEKK